MKREIRSLGFAIMFLVLLSVYFFSVLYLTNLYNRLNLANEKTLLDKQVGFNGLASLDFIWNNSLTIMFYLDIIAASATIIFFIILIFLIIRKSEDDNNKKFFIVQARKLLRAMKDNGLSDREVIENFRKKDWKEEDIDFIISNNNL